MTADYRIERLTPARGDDFLRFFDHEHGPAFADNPDWAKCYCHFYHVPKAIDWKSLDGNANRTAMAARIGVAQALLAGALASFEARGVRTVDAFPFKSEDSSKATDHYHGPMPLFQAAGFEVLVEHPDLTVMRKRFPAPH